MEPEGIGLIEFNPLFNDEFYWDFSYEELSPCIDAGDPNQQDPDGTIRDIGAISYTDNNISDCNNDNMTNILDIVYLLNDCILVNSDYCDCGDINMDNIINILDIVVIINQILDSRD